MSTLLAKTKYFQEDKQLSSILFQDLQKLHPCITATASFSCFPFTGHRVCPFIEQLSAYKVDILGGGTLLSIQTPSC